MTINKHKIFRVVRRTLWSLVGAGTIVLLVAAIRIKDAEACRGIYINIKGVNNIFFIDKKDVMDSVMSIEGCNPVGQPVSSFNLRAMEGKLTNNIWIRNAQLFFDNNDMLQIEIMESEPVARLFTVSGNTFYIDSALNRLPLSSKFSARVPVFTGFPSDRIILTQADSSLLMDIKNISLSIQQDPFSMGLIDQVDITPQRTFEMMPEIGNNIIEFGDATDATAKLHRLKLFYQDVLLKAGMNYYSVIDVQYKGQVVAKRKSAEDITADSLKTVQLMQQIATNAEKQSSDSAQLQPEVKDSTGSSDINMQSPAETDDADSTDNTTKPAHIDKDKKKDTTSAKPIIPVKAIKPAVTTGDKKPGDAKPVVKPKPAPKKPANDY
jgi:cell division protein FtsQ